MNIQKGVIFLARKLTNFTFFKNTPLIDFQNTIHFSSNQERDNFFLNGNHYPTLGTEYNDFNFIRDKSELVITVPYDQMRGVNYCTFLSEFEPNTRYYAYVINYEYVGPSQTRVYLLIDPIMTFTQGNVLENINNLKVYRKHMDKQEYDERLWELKNNDDVLKTSTKTYFQQKDFSFEEFDILILSSVDLREDFGTVDDPKMTAASGTTFDETSAPLNIYHCVQDAFNTVMNDLKEYPWITQNFRSIILIPKTFINQDLLTPVDIQGVENQWVPLNIYRSGLTERGSEIDQFLTEIATFNSPMWGLYNDFNIGVNSIDRHLLRNEYTTTEIYSWDGQQMMIDNGLLNEDTGLKFNGVIVTGYHNEVALYIENYKVKDLQLDGSNNPIERQGSFLNDAIFFRDFDDIPMAIDNYNLALSRNANVRRLAEDKLVSNRVETVIDSEASLKDRFFEAANLISNISLDGLFGKFSDERDYYRQQEAEFKDLALSSSTITQQSTNNALKRANNYYGFSLKHSKPSDGEWNKLKKYYRLFGHQVNDEHSSIKVATHTICNYLQFGGSWTLANVDVALIEMMKAQFENGVRFWHNNNTPNPMSRNVLSNTWR